MKNESEDQHKRATGDSTDNGADSSEKRSGGFPVRVVRPLLLLLSGNTQFNSSSQHGPFAIFAIRTYLKIAAHEST